MKEYIEKTNELFDLMEATGDQVLVHEQIFILREI